MEEPMQFNDYLEACKETLQQDKPEDVQNIFTVLNAVNSDYRPFFVNQFHKTIRDYYLVVALKRPGDRSAIFPGWAEKNPEWPEKLKTALYAGRVGDCARMLKMSLLQYEADQNAGGR